MNFLAVGKRAYSVVGGIQADSCRVYSKVLFQQLGIATSIKAQLRDNTDKAPLWQTTLFSKTINKTGASLPSDDYGRMPIDYITYNGWVIEAQEVDMATASNVMNTALQFAVAVKKLEVISKFYSLPDITADVITKIDNALNTAWSEIESCGTIAGSLDTLGGMSVACSGIPLYETFNFTYNDFIKLGTLRVTLLERV